MTSAHYLLSDLYVSDDIKAYTVTSSNSGDEQASGSDMSDCSETDSDSLHVTSVDDSVTSSGNGCSDTSNGKIEPQPEVEVCEIVWLVAITNTTVHVICFLFHYILYSIVQYVIVQSRQIIACHFLLRLE